MRLVKYKTHWSYLGPAVKREEPLSEFVLDIPYLIESLGVIPPLHIINEVLGDGGNNGGMSPGTTWRPFKLKVDEYNELVAALLALDIEVAKQSHPYVKFTQVVNDLSLTEAKNYNEWFAAAMSKYARSET